MMWRFYFILCSLTVIKGLVVANEIENDPVLETQTASTSVTRIELATDTETIVSAQTVSRAFTPLLNNHLVTDPTPTLENINPISTEPPSFLEIEASPYGTEFSTASPIIGHTSTAALLRENTRDDFDEQELPFAFSSRGDLPPQLDSEESTDGVIKPFLFSPTQTLFSLDKFIFDVNQTNAPVNIEDSSELGESMKNASSDESFSQIPGTQRSELLDNEFTQAENSVPINSTEGESRQIDSTIQDGYNRTHDIFHEEFPGGNSSYTMNNFPGDGSTRLEHNFTKNSPERDNEQVKDIFTSESSEDDFWQLRGVLTSNSPVGDAQHPDHILNSESSAGRSTDYTHVGALPGLNSLHNNAFSTSDSGQFHDTTYTESAEEDSLVFKGNISLESPQNHSFETRNENASDSELHKYDDKFMTNSPGSNNEHKILENVAEVRHMFSTTQNPDVYENSLLFLHEKWMWFYMVLRGNCHFVDLRDNQLLLSDFINSFSALLLYNREHLIVDSMTCAGRRMTVNMSIDSTFYPNWEKDLRTLLTHRNLRINLHNTSFYIHSYETKRASIFDTKHDAKENQSREKILYITLGGVGISLICVFFAGLFFAIYQCCGGNKTKARNTEVSNRFRTESPRSLKPKFEIDQNMSYSDQMTYSVNMYKSYTDLSAPDLYSHLGSPNTHAQDNEKSPRNTKILTKIPKEKNKKKKKKTKYNGIGMADCDAFQEYWSESITHANEDLMTVKNLNSSTTTSSFRTESDRDSLFPLLKKSKPVPPAKKPTWVYEDLPIPHPPPPPPPASTTCPSTPAFSRSVLERMDQLITDEFSSSTPDVNAGSNYSRSYSNTTINIANASSAVFSNGTVDMPQQHIARSTSITSPEKILPPPPNIIAPSRTSTSAENLCLTRITFMEMCVWPKMSNSQPQNFIGGHNKGPTHL